MPDSGPTLASPGITPPRCRRGHGALRPRQALPKPYGETRHSRCSTYPVHGEVNPEGIVQLVQQFHKSFFLSAAGEKRAGVKRGFS